MPQTETLVSQLKINRLTKTQFDGASELSETELYAVDPQFTGGKLLVTDSDGNIVESTATEADALAGSTALQPNDNISSLVNDAGYTTNVGTVTSVNNVSPVSGNVTLSIPTVNDSTITITQGGATKGSFTLNQSSGDTIALDAGGDPLPSQTGNSGKFLTTDGTDASWATATKVTIRRL